MLVGILLSARFVSPVGASRDEHGCMHARSQKGYGSLQVVYYIWARPLFDSSRSSLFFAPASASSDYYEVVDADDDDDTNGDDSE